MKFSFILFILIMLFYFILNIQAQITLSDSCPLLFKEFKLKANYTVAENGTFDLKKYGCSSCFNSTLNASVSCEPCYLESKGYYQNIPLKEYVVLTKTDLDLKFDKILINNELEFFKIIKNNLTLNFEDKIKLNNTKINFKKDDKICVYDTSVEKTCSNLKGYICNTLEDCPGLLIYAEDTDKCCDRLCKNQTKSGVKVNETINLTNNTISSNETIEEIQTKELSLSSEIYDNFFKRIIKWFLSLF